IGPPTPPRSNPAGERRGDPRPKAAANRDLGPVPIPPPPARSGGSTPGTRQSAPPRKRCGGWHPPTPAAGAWARPSLRPFRTFARAAFEGRRPNPASPTAGDAPPTRRGSGDPPRECRGCAADGVPCPFSPSGPKGPPGPCETGDDPTGGASGSGNRADPPHPAPGTAPADTFPDRPRRLPPPPALPPIPAATA